MTIIIVVPLENKHYTNNILKHIDEWTFVFSDNMPKIITIIYNTYYARYNVGTYRYDLSARTCYITGNRETLYAF